jgi:hypothetical protein
MLWDEDVNEFHIPIGHNQHEKKDSVDLEIEKNLKKFKLVVECAGTYLIRHALHE